MSRSWNDDGGFSLVEVLISIVIVGICFAGLLGGMAASALTSGIHRDQADGHTLLVSAAEAVKDQSRNPFACSAATYDPVDGVTVPSGWSAGDVVIDTVEHGYWDGSDFVTTPTCSSATDLQRIKLKATSPEGRALEALTVIKRRP